MSNILLFVVVVPHFYRLIDLSEHTLLRKGTKLYTNRLLMSNKWLLGNETTMDIELLFAL
jgi:ABC-type cobalamin transport system permease subunit